MAFGAVKKKVDNAKRALGYGKDSYIAKNWGIAGKALSAGLSGIKLALWRQEKFHGVKYGDVRDFMLDNGILEWFKSSRILGTIGKAESLVELLHGKDP